jgi:hypothetical protein
MYSLYTLDRALMSNMVADFCEWWKEIGWECIATTMRVFSSYYSVLVGSYTVAGGWAVFLKKSHWRIEGSLFTINKATELLRKNSPPSRMYKSDSSRWLKCVCSSEKVKNGWALPLPKNRLYTMINSSNAIGSCELSVSIAFSYKLFLM